MSHSDSQNNLELPSQVLQKKFSVTKADITENKFNPTSFNPYVFMAGDLGLILESETTVSEVIDNLPMCQIPNAAPWLHAMANLRGTITPIFNLSIIFGFENEHNNIDSKLLIIGSKEKAIGVLIDKTPFRIILSDSDKVELSANLPTQLSPYVRNCYKKNNSIWVDWDVYGLFNSLI